MSVYVIGDVQGCYDELMALLEQCAFEPGKDKVWLVGDLVNRGPQSLEVLRWAKSQHDSCVCVLGNHDLHLLAAAAGCAKLHKSDTLNAILNAPDREELLTWLRQQSLVHQEGDFLMVHAGLWPDWTVQQSLVLAAEVQERLRRDDYLDFLQHMYGNQPTRWSDSLQGMERLRFIVNVMTRMRLISLEGELDLKFKGELPDAPPGLVAWFDRPHVRKGVRVLTGHWSALGMTIQPDLITLDTGCVWGDRLTAYRLEDGQVFQQASFQEKPLMFP